MPKIYDKIGNEIAVGQMHFFDPVRGIVQVVEVQEPGNKEHGLLGWITLNLRIPFQSDPRQPDKPFRFDELLRVHTPDEGENAEQAVKRILDKTSGGPRLNLETLPSRQKGK